MSEGGGTCEAAGRVLLGLGSSSSQDLFVRLAMKTRAEIYSSLIFCNFMNQGTFS